MLSDRRLRQITLFGANTSTPGTPPSNWSNLSYYEGNADYGPVAVMTLPDDSKVRYLKVMARSSDGYVIIKEAQVFQCVRKFYMSM